MFIKVLVPSACHLVLGWKKNISGEDSQRQVTVCVWEGWEGARRVSR
jgi:hypothetical protein